MGKVYKPKQDKIIFSIRAIKLVDQDCLAYLAHLRDVDIEASSIEFIHILFKFTELFPNDMPRMRLNREHVTHPIWTRKNWERLNLKYNNSFIIDLFILFFPLECSAFIC